MGGWEVAAMVTATGGSLLGQVIRLRRSKMRFEQLRSLVITQVGPVKIIDRDGDGSVTSIHVETAAPTVSDSGTRPVNDLAQ